MERKDALNYNSDTQDCYSSKVNEPVAMTNVTAIPMHSSVIAELRDKAINIANNEENADVLEDWISMFDNAKCKHMKEYCESHFSKDFAEEMASKNFFIGEPKPSNEQDFEDLEKMFEEAEASGECTDEEVKAMFAV